MCEALDMKEAPQSESLQTGIPKNGERMSETTSNGENENIRTKKGNRETIELIDDSEQKLIRCAR